MFYKVKVVDMPAGSSWQDLKDFCRKVQTVTPRSATIEDRDSGEGIVGFASRQEAMDVVDQLNGDYFRARDGSKSKVQIEYMYEQEPGRGRELRSRSRGAGGGRGGGREEVPDKSSKGRAAGRSESRSD